MEKEIYLGQTILVDHKLKRVKKIETREDEFWKTQCNYRVKAWEEVPLKHSYVGVIVGVRTLSNGITEYDPEAGHMYSPESHFQALLVSVNLRTKPFYMKMPPR